MVNSLWSPGVTCRYKPRGLFLPLGPASMRDESGFACLPQYGRPSCLVWWTAGRTSQASLAYLPYGHQNRQGHFNSREDESSIACLPSVWYKWCWGG